MSDKIVNHFVLADGSTAKYDAGSLLNLDETVSLAGYAPDAKAVGDRLTDVENFALTMAVRTKNLFNKDNYEIFNGFDLTGTVQSSSNVISVLIPVNVTTETMVVAHRNTITSRYALSAYTEKPVAGMSSVYHTYNNSANTISIAVDATIKYLMVYLWRTEDDPITLDEMTEGLMVQFGDTYTGYEPYYYSKITENQIVEDMLSVDLNRKVATGETSNIVFGNNINLWEFWPVLKNTRLSGYNTTTYEINTTTDDDFETVIVDIPKNVDLITIKCPATIPAGGQAYIAISDTLQIATNRHWSAFANSFRDAYANYNNGAEYYTLNLYEMRNKGYKRLAISTYKEPNMYVFTNKTNSAWLIDKPDIYCPIGAFNSIGAVGDSYTAGSILKSDNSWIDVPEHSYIAVMAKRAGVEWSNYGYGGANTRTYIDLKLADVLSANPNDFYFLALGINDSSLGLNYIGTISDIKQDYTQNPDTFYGNYGKIIDQIKTHAPNARFCMVKTPIYLAIGTELDAAIGEIAVHYGFACIDPKDDYFFKSNTFYSRVSNHPSCIGYAGMAIAYERLLSKAIDENPLYFFYSNIDANIPESIS